MPVEVGKRGIVDVLSQQMDTHVIVDFRRRVVTEGFYVGLGTLIDTSLFRLDELALAGGNRDNPQLSFSSLETQPGLS
jgi:hypothetical protein